MGSCETTHERVCGLGSGVSGQLRAVTQTDSCFGLTCKSEGYKSLSDGEKRWGGEVLEISYCKASCPSFHFVSAKALHFL